MNNPSIMGALALYLDFINLFLLLLRIFGRRKQAGSRPSAAGRRGKRVNSSLKDVFWGFDSYFAAKTPGLLLRTSPIY